MLFKLEGNYGESVDEYINLNHVISVKSFEIETTSLNSSKSKKLYRLSFVTVGDQGRHGDNIYFSNYENAEIRDRNLARILSYMGLLPT